MVTRSPEQAAVTTSDAAVAVSDSATRQGSRWRLQLSAGYLAIPMLAFLTYFFFYPAIGLLFSSIQTQNSQGIIGRPFTLAHYARLIDVDLYARVFWNTLRISVIVSLLATVLAYPVALVMVKSRPTITRIITLIVIAPLIVSVVVRGYGWQLVLTNGPKGMLNWILMTLHIVDAPVSILYTEKAVIIGSLHVFFPMMVLPLASALGKIDPNLEDAARMLGAPWWKVFLRVTLPLSMPGFVAGFTLVFSLTAGSFVIPAILGGASAIMLGNLIEQQIFVVYDWPFGAAIALVLVGVVFAVNGFSMWLLEGRRLRRAT